MPFDRAQKMVGQHSKWGAVVNGWPPTKHCWASDFEKVALSLRDRRRDQQGGVDLPSHLGSTANATRVFSLPVAERQGYHPLATAPRSLGCRVPSLLGGTMTR